MRRRPYRNLADYLRYSGDTQAALAARLGVTQATISLAKRGRCSLAMAKRISLATRTPLESYGEPNDDDGRRARR